VENGENNLGMLYAKNPHFTKGIFVCPPGKPSENIAVIDGLNVDKK